MLKAQQVGASSRSSSTRQDCVRKGIFFLAFEKALSFQAHFSYFVGRGEFYFTLVFRHQGLVILIICPVPRLQPGWLSSSLLSLCLKEEPGGWWERAATFPSFPKAEEQSEIGSPV